jgi:hypothetical protein
MFSLAPAWAQVAVEVLQDQDQFLRGESIPAKVRITNRSGQILRLGAEENWLSFAVESRDGSVVVQSGDVPVIGEFTLDSSEMGTKLVDLAPYFALTQPGRYTVTATIRIKGWDHEVTSRPRNFDVIEGTVLFEQEFGLPPTDGSTNSYPEVRKYIIQQVNHLRQRELRLYLRVTDTTGAKIFKVVSLGSMVTFGRPEFQMDRLSNLHVIFQKGPHTFSYTQFDPSGELLARQTYEHANNRPKLQPVDDGTISVAGGLRRPAANDVPPWKPETTTPDEVQTPKK